MDIYEFNLNEPISIDERLVLENQKLKIKFKHNYASYDSGKHGNLMILVHYDIAFMSMKAKLLQNDGKKQDFIKFGTNDFYEEELGTETSLHQMAHSITYSIPSDFYTGDGNYLEAEFTITDKFLSLFEDQFGDSSPCFPINLMIQYVPPGTGANAKVEEDEDIESGIKFITPAILNDVPIMDYHNITLNIELDRSIIEAYPNIDPTSSMSGTMIQQMCALEHSEGSQFTFFELNTDISFMKTNTIFPIEYYVSSDYKRIGLQFAVSQAYEDSCYKLVCRKDPTVLQGTYYDVKDIYNIKTSYCFGKEVKGNAIANKE